MILHNSNIKKTALIIILVSLSTCVDSPIEPVPQPGSRDYVWTIDTLGTSDDSFGSIWGNTPSDVWSTSAYSYPPNNILHFDGIEWKAVGPYKDFLANCIWGFSSNNVWFGGSNSELWNYDGNEWQIAAELTDESSQISFQRLWGNENIFFAFGAYPDENSDYNNPTIAHLKNGKWTMLNTDGIVGIVARLFLNYKQELYIQNIKWGNATVADSTQIYEYNNGSFKLLYSSLWSKGYTADISLINNEVYFVLGRQIAVRKNNQFQTVLNIDDPNFYGRIWGRTIKDIFIEMSDGLAHYNGNNIEYFHHFNNNSWSNILDAILFKEEVFFLVRDYNTHISLIYHGKLKKGG